jgi:hypothetical protein
MVTDHAVRTQIAHLAFVSKLVAKGGRAHLPLLAWSVSTGTVTGTVDTTLDTDEQRRQWQAWADLVDATKRREWTGDDGTTHLTASRSYPRDSVTVVIQAVLS